MVKRRTRKENEVLTSVPSGTQGNQTLYTVPQDRQETFVGLKGNLQLTPSGTVAGDIAVVFHHTKQNVAAPVINATANSPISDRMYDVLFSYMFNVDPDVDDLVGIPLDIKAMRKMNEGDIIFMSTIASGSGVGEVNGNVNIFLKEAS